MLLPKAASGRQFAVHETETTPWHRQFADGFRFIVADRMLLTLWLFSTFIGICVSAATATFVLFLVVKAGMPEALFGVFLLTGAVGGILGSVLAAPAKERFGAGRVMAVASLASALALIFVGLVPQLWAAAVGFFLSSLAVTSWNILVMSLRQSIIPGRLLGRVHGTWRTLLWGGMPLGSLIGGALGRIDLVVPFLVGGGLPRREHRVLPLPLPTAQPGGRRQRRPASGGRGFADRRTRGCRSDRPARDERGLSREDQADAREVLVRIEVRVER